MFRPPLDNKGGIWGDLTASFTCATFVGLRAAYDVCLPCITPTGPPTHKWPYARQSAWHSEASLRRQVHSSAGGHAMPRQQSRGGNEAVKGPVPAALPPKPPTPSGDIGSRRGGREGSAVHPLDGTDRCVPTQAAVIRGTKKTFPPIAMDPAENFRRETRK